MTGPDGSQLLRFCPVCGQTKPPHGSCPNRWCGRPDRAFSVVFAAATYDAGVRRAVLRYKYGGERWRAAALGELLGSYLAAHSPCFDEFDLLVTVPSYVGAGARRHWDPVGGIAAAAESVLGAGWSWSSGAVVKSAETPPMQGRSWRERRAIAEGPLRRALRVPEPSAVAGARVLVTDDVFTGGSTLREVAIALRRAGAVEVAGLAVARLPWRPSSPSSRPPGRFGGRAA